MFRVINFIMMTAFLVLLSCNHHTIENRDFKSDPVAVNLKSISGIPFVAKHGDTIGFVNIYSDDKNITLEVELDRERYPDLELVKSYLFLEDQPPEFDEGHCNYTHKEIFDKSDSFTLKLADLQAGPENVFYIAFHADVIEATIDPQSQTEVVVFEDQAWIMDETLNGWTRLDPAFGGYFNYTL